MERVHRDIRHGVAPGSSGIRHASAPDTGMERLQPQRHSIDCLDRLQKRPCHSQGAERRNPPHKDRRIAGVIALMRFRYTMPILLKSTDISVGDDLVYPGTVL